MVRPKTISASSLQVASQCMKRYVAENLNYARGIANNAAMTGSSCHYALEHYVKRVYMEKTDEPGLELLLKLLEAGYTDTFGDTNYTSPEFKDAAEMLTNWFDQADFSGREVLSVEEKNRYPLQLSDGSILPVTYIWDRQDKLDDGTIVVVDYKSNRFNIGSTELKNKIQAKLYALIANILYPDAEYIRVEFHMLRHGITGVTFTRNDNAETWNWLLAEVSRILASPLEAKPTLNNECGFCICKSTCPAILVNIENDGVMSLKPPELVDRLYQLKSQADAAKSAAAEIEDILGPLLRPGGDVDNVIEGATHRAYVDARTVRSVNTDMAIRILDDEEIEEEYVPRKSLTLAGFDKLLKDPRITTEKRKALRSLIGKTVQQPSIKLEKL